MTSQVLGSTVALKENRIQLVTDAFGNVPAGNTGGLGLYMDDTRYLSTFELRVEDMLPIYLSHSSERNYIATFQFVNPEFVLRDGTKVPRQTISIRRSRFVDGKAVRERVGFYNCNQFPVEIEATLVFDADFLDIFAVRKYFPHRRGDRRSARFGRNRLSFSYTGRDKVSRQTIVNFSPRPEPTGSNAMLFRLLLEPHKPASISLTIEPGAGPRREAGTTSGSTDMERGFDIALESLAKSYDSWHHASTSYETNNEFFDRSLLRQSRLDIRALLEFPDAPTEWDDGRDNRLHEVVPDAGIPWYAVPFGRDAIITAIQTLSYNPEIAVGTLLLLAKHQGLAEDEKTEEQPGKIFHELRRGELANLREIPHLPYYGTVDATPLFVVLFVETMAWLGETNAGNQLYRDLLPAALKALEWVDAFGDADGDGYVEYGVGSAGLLTNQGWKDSSESILYPDGSMVRFPVALVEVQGYVYQAKAGLAELSRARGDHELAVRLAGEADRLRARFNSDFWMEDEAFFAQALDGEKKRVPSITSNAGHLLWSGIVDPEKARAVIDRLMAEDLFSGWGIRTLSGRSPNFNPMSYHNGSVWPHDNALIALGARRYGFAHESAEIISAMIGAGLRFPGNRLPELFCGFPRDRRFNSSPAAYIVSCSPQAWAAASPFLFLQTMLDIRPQNGLSVNLDPIANDLFNRFTVRHMRVGPNRISFEAVEKKGEFVIRPLDGDVDIISETARLAV